LQTATNPETNEQFALIDNEWQPMPAAAAPEPETFRPFQTMMDGALEGLATVGTGVAGGLAGTASALWDTITGEDYETARATQDRIAGDLTYTPRTPAGVEAVQTIGGWLDNPLFNAIGEASETWGQGTNDYLEDSPVDFAAPTAGILASMGPDILAGVATGGAGAAGTRVARLAGSEILDGVQDATQGIRASSSQYLDRAIAKKDEYMARRDERFANMDDSAAARKQRKAREEAMAPALRESVEAEGSPAGLSVGAAEAELARRNVELAADMPYPITLTQGQATRNAAQMSDEYNLIRQGQPEDVAPLAMLKEEQQRALQQNLQYVADTLDRAEPAKLGSDELLGRSIKETLEKRKAERKEKTGALYNAAEEQGDLDMPIAIDTLDQAFATLERKRFNRTEPGKMRLLQELADDIGVSGGQPARIRDVEEFRQQINNVLNDPTNSNDKAMAKILKKSVDDALDAAPKAAEAYKRARASYARDKSAFDGNALVTNITGRKGRTESPAVPDADVYRRIATGPMEDVRRLLREAAKTPGGVNMIHNIGARLMDDLIKASTKSGVDGDGGFNSARFAAELRKLDKSGRLEAIYGPRRADQLRRVAEVGEMINSLPYGNAANVSQSGNTLVKEALDIVAKLPMGVVSTGARGLGNMHNDGVLRTRQQERVKKALDVEGLLSYE
jgi:hypothetical protein